MAQSPVVIELTAAQRALIREASGKNVAKLGIEPVDTGSGWLYSAGGKKFWLLKHPDPESYEAARQKAQPRIDPRHARFRLKIGESRIHRWGVFAEERIPARRNVIEYVGELVNPVESYRRTKDASGDLRLPARRVLANRRCGRRQRRGVHQPQLQSEPALAKIAGDASSARACGPSPWARN